MVRAIRSDTRDPKNGWAPVPECIAGPEIFALADDFFEISALRNLSGCHQLNFEIWQRLAFAPQVSQRFRIVGGANHGLPGNIRPCPHRDLAPGEVTYTDPVASLAPFPCGPADSFVRVRCSPP